MSDRDIPLGEIQDDTVVDGEEASLAKAGAITHTLDQQTSKGHTPAGQRNQMQHELRRAAQFEQQGGDLVEQIKSAISIFDAYDSVIGGKTAKGWGRKADGNLATCPMPDHPDNNPSTSFSEDGLWKCFSCSGAGDLIDLYAIAQHYSVPAYRNSAQDFRECIENACGMLGIDIPYYEAKDDPVGSADEMQRITEEAMAKLRDNPEALKESLQDVEIEIEVDEPVQDQAEEPQSGAARVSLKLEFTGGTIAPQGTFLGDWMHAHAKSKERSPREYHFFCGLAALGQAAGRSIYLDDPQGDIYGNLGVVLYGHTGARKSAALNNMTRLLQEAIPFNADDKDSTGVRSVVMPASGEALIDQMRRTDSEGKDQEDGDPMRGVLALDELEGLMKLMRRHGSTLQDAIMQFLDGKGSVGVMSRGGGFQVASEASLSFVTATQPNAVQGFMDNAAISNGFLNRFLFVYGEPTKRQLDATKVEMGRSAARLIAINAWAPRTGKIAVDRQVMQALVDVAEDVIDPILVNGDNHLMNRIELHHKRLAFLFAVNEMATALSLRHVEMATHLLTSFIIPTFNAADEDIDRKALSEVMTGITEFVRAKFANEEYDKLTRGRVRSNVRACRKNPDIVDRAFDTLIKEQVIAEWQFSSMGARKRLLPFEEFVQMGGEDT